MATAPALAWLKGSGGLLGYTRNVRSGNCRNRLNCPTPLLWSIRTAERSGTPLRYTPVASAGLPRRLTFAVSSGLVAAGRLLTASRGSALAVALRYTSSCVMATVANSPWGIRAALTVRASAVVLSTRAEVSAVSCASSNPGSNTMSSPRHITYRAWATVRYRRSRIPVGPPGPCGR